MKPRPLPQTAGRLEVVSLSLPAVQLFRSVAIADTRGEMAMTHSRAAFDALGIGVIAEEYSSRSPKAGTVRGLHFQAPPYGQTKLVRIVRGRVFAVAVDLRRQSDSFGVAVTAELDESGWTQFLAPIGFAFGYCTLTDNVEMSIKVSLAHTPAAARGVLWSDPALAVAWPVTPDEAIIDGIDAAWPSLDRIANAF